MLVYVKGGIETMIYFILPSPSLVPNGGHKIVYEYANRLSQKYKVGIIYSVVNPHQTFRRLKKFPMVRFLYVYLNFLLKRYQWFPLKKNVSEKVVFKLDDSHVNINDVVIATFWSTAYSVKQLKCENKYYLIQSYEDWAGDKLYVEKSYLLGLKNIVIAKWIGEKIKLLSADIHALVPNGLDFSELQLQQRIDQRNPVSFQNKQTCRLR